MHGLVAHRQEELTRRDRDVMAGIATGRMNRDMAASLGRSVGMVEFSRESPIRQLGMLSVAGLRRFALEGGEVGR